MPAKVDELFKEVKKDNPSYTDERAWATAWSIYCKHVEPGSDHCSRPPSEYLKGKNAAGAFARALLAREFATPEALKEYLHEHPKADKSKHTVKKEEEGKGGKKEEPKAPAKPKGLDFGDTSKLGKDVTQPVKDPDKLFEEAAKAHDHQLDWLNRGKGLDKAIGGKVIRADKGDTIDFDKPGPIILIGPMKKQDRSKEKVEADFGGDWSRLGDIVRASVAVDSFDQVEEVLAQLKKTGLKLARQPKDRFDTPTSAGYRDVMINVVYPNGHVGELQLHLKGVLKAKDAGHKFYEEVRSIEGKAKKEGRDTLTEEELKVITEANDKMKALYDEAWASASKAKGKGSKGRKTKEAASGPTKYDYNGLPAYWDKNRFPMVVTPKGEKPIYDIEKFFREADEVTEAEFKALKDRSKPEKKSPAGKKKSAVMNALMARKVVARFLAADSHNPDPLSFNAFLSEFRQGEKSGKDLASAEDAEAKLELAQEKVSQAATDLLELARRIDAIAQRGPLGVNETKLSAKLSGILSTLFYQAGVAKGLGKA